MSEPIAFATPAAFGDWLAEHHASAPEVWVLMYRAHTGAPSITWEDGIREALCWGWIDAVKRSLGAEAWVQRFCPRRSRSRWSKRNCDWAEALIAEGRMQPPGLAEVAAAKADGRWDAAYAGPAKMEVPEDFLAALAEAPALARETYAGLDRKNLYAIGYRVTTARTAETRRRRIATLIATLARGERFH
jgi:uncharacterized protein YdeI (YjbR/CyaY-like superfamily)